MATTYHIELRKYMRLYAVLPPLITFILYGGDAFSGEGLGFLITGILAMHILYYWRVQKYFVVVVGDESLQLFGLLGHKEEIPYNDLAGPLERNLGIVRYYDFVSMKNPARKLVITNYTEKLDQCLAEIAAHIAKAS